MILLSTKLKNALPSEFTVSMKNVIINGDKRGCTGFVSHNGLHVYVNTEVLGGRFLFRTARGTSDYVGGDNKYVYTLEQLTDSITALLKTPK